MLSSHCFQALVLTPRLLLQLGQLLHIPLSCWPGPVVGVSPYSVTISSCILTVHSQQPASSRKISRTLAATTQLTGTLTDWEVEDFLVKHTVVPATTGPS